MFLTPPFLPQSRRYPTFCYCLLLDWAKGMAAHTLDIMPCIQVLVDSLSATVQQLTLTIVDKGNTIDELQRKLGTIGTKAEIHSEEASSLKYQLSEQASTWYTWHSVLIMCHMHWLVRKRCLDSIHPKPESVSCRIVHGARVSALCAVQNH